MRNLKLIFTITALLSAHAFGAMNGSGSTQTPDVPMCLNQDGCTGIGTPYGSCISTGNGCYAINPNGGGQGGGGGFGNETLLEEQHVLNTNGHVLEEMNPGGGSNNPVTPATPKTSVTKTDIVKIGNECGVIGKTVKLSTRQCARIVCEGQARTEAGCFRKAIASIPQGMKIPYGSLKGTYAIYNTGVQINHGTTYSTQVDSKFNDSTDDGNTGVIINNSEGHAISNDEAAY